MTDRRSFLMSSSAAAIASMRLSRGLMASTTQGSDPIKNLIVVNALGGLDEGYAPPPPGPPAVMSAGAMAAGKSSGLTAINMTLAGGDDFETTVEAIAAYDAFIHANSDKLLKVYSTADILDAKKQGKIGVIYGFQNAAMMGDKTARVDIFADLGVRCIQLTYNSLNQLGGGSMDPANTGLTAFGREVVAKLNERRVMVDLSHSGRQICLDAARASTAPISINHTGCQAIVDVPRNKTDEELKLVADRGGFVGIYFVMFVAEGREATIDDVVAHIEHALKVCGEDHVGIGSDYGIVNLGDMQGVRDFWATFVRRRMENKSAARGEDPNILPFAQGLIGPEQFRSLYRALEKRGHKTAVIEKVLGQNYMRFARETWGA